MQSTRSFDYQLVLDGRVAMPKSGAATKGPQSREELRPGSE